MRRWFSGLIVGGATVMAAAIAPAAEPDRADVEFFEARVRPVLARQCYKCHSASSESVKAGLRLDSRDGMIKGGDSGPAIVPGNPDKSLLIKAVGHDPATDLEMPPKTKLPASTIDDLAAWIRRGAAWPTEQAPPAVADTRRERRIVEARERHWAFQPLTTPTVPSIANRAWGRTPIDAFVLAKLEEKGMKPAAPVEPSTLLRRVYLDLIGLPPTPDEQHRFLNDPSPAALEHVVDELLARPQYGERWGRHWLDTARFAESNGYEHDEPKPHAWRYRDYVINAFNADKPYDRFVTEQLAGDELPDTNADAQIATTFLRVGPFDTTAADGKLARYDQLDDIVGTTTAAFLGQTVRCARCHDHKFEPYAQVDYYKLLAVFEPLRAGPPEGVLVGTPAELAAYQAAQAAVDREAEPIHQRREAIWLKILDRAQGADAAKAKGLDQGAIAVLRKPADKRNKGDLDRLAKARAKLAEGFEKLATAQEKSELAEFAKSLAALEAKRPQGTFAHLFEERGTKPAATHLFYRGDCNKPGPEVAAGVPTVLGGDALPPPTPTAQTSGRRLWLAKWMTEGSAKPLLARVIVNRIWQHHFGTGLIASANDFGVHGDAPSHPELLEWLADDFVRNGWHIKRLHRQIVLSSVYQTSAAHRTHPADPDGRLLAYWHTRRLESEAIRDSILAVSGGLNGQTGGPSVCPPLTQRIVGNSASQDWPTSDTAQSARRSVYVCVKRNILVPEMEVLGIADSASSVESRPVATTALQSLMLLNSKFASEQAALLAKRVRTEVGDDRAAQIRRAFELTLCRPPKPNEATDAAAYLATGGGTSPDQALAGFCLVLLNTNEFIYTN